MRLTRLATAITPLERPIDSAFGWREAWRQWFGGVVRGAHGRDRGVGGRGRRSVGATSSGAATSGGVGGGATCATGAEVGIRPGAAWGAAGAVGRGPGGAGVGGRSTRGPGSAVGRGPGSRRRRPRSRRRGAGVRLRRPVRRPGLRDRQGCRGRPLRGRSVRRPGAVAGDRQADGRVGGLLDRGRRPRGHPRRGLLRLPHPAPDPPGREQHEESARDRRQPRGDGAVGGGAHLQVAGRPEHPTVRGAHHRVDRELPRPRDLRVHRHLAAAERRDLLDVDRRDPQPGRALELHLHPHGDGQRVGHRDRERRVGAAERVRVGGLQHADRVADRVHPRQHRRGGVLRGRGRPPVGGRRPAQQPELQGREQLVGRDADVASTTALRRSVRARAESASTPTAAAGTSAASTGGSGRTGVGAAVSPRGVGEPGRGRPAPR